MALPSLDYNPNAKCSALLKRKLLNRLWDCALQKFKEALLLLDESEQGRCEVQHQLHKISAVDQVQVLTDAMDCAGL
jgi:hypothetical protein